MHIAPLPDDVWQAIECHLHDHEYPPRVSDRRLIEGLVFVLRHNVSLRTLPATLACGSITTVWRRLRKWRRNEQWSMIVHELRQRLPDGNILDWDRLGGAHDIVHPEMSNGASEADPPLTHKPSHSAGVAGMSKRR